MIKIKRVYEEPSNEDGTRILVDRLWPRGLSKEKAKVDLWLKEIAPSEGLRKWFAHETGKWEEFCKRYWMELEQKRDLITLIEQKNKDDTVTFVYAAHNEKNNNALALKMFIKWVQRGKKTPDFSRGDELPLCKCNTYPEKEFVQNNI